MRSEWLAHPFVREYLTRLRQGLSLEDWVIRFILDNRPRQRGLGIGTGSGEFELSLVKVGMVEQYDFFDVSQGMLDRGYELATQMKIADRVNFFCLDVGNLALPNNHYDLVTFSHSLHHMIELKKVLSLARAALRPGGVLFADEYVGPDRFAFPESDLRMARQLYNVLNPVLKCPWPAMPVPDPAEVMEADPTEAVHSTEIIETIRTIFGNCHVTSYQTALTPILWYGLNFDTVYETSQGQGLVKFLLELDQLLVSTGRLKTYYAYLHAFKEAF